MGFNEFMTKLFGNKSQRDLKEITPYVDKIKAVYPSIQKLSNDELRAKTDEIKQRIQDYVADERAKVEELRKGIDNKELEEREAIWAEVDKIEKNITEKMEVVLEEVLPEVFSIMKDTARRFSENETIEVTANDFDRNLATKYDFVEINGDKAIYHNHWVAGGNEITWDMVHYDVQLFGGVVLHKGKIAEMATGEGKTLVATLPVFLNALTRNGVHVVTVNDYLSKRDSEWMGPLYMFHGLSVDCIDKHQPNSDARRAAYNADITFGTNNEFGFDYLRDNMAISPNDLVQRKHNYAIVDEVDSVYTVDYFRSDPSRRRAAVRTVPSERGSSRKRTERPLFQDADRSQEENGKQRSERGGRRFYPTVPFFQRISAQQGTDQIPERTRRKSPDVEDGRIFHVRKHASHA